MVGERRRKTNPVAAQTVSKVHLRDQTSEVKGDGPKAQTDAPRSIEHSMTAGRGKPPVVLPPIAANQVPVAQPVEATV